MSASLAHPTATPPSPLAAPGRLAALRQTGLLDSSAHDGLDRLTALAARLLGAPTALVSLVDPERQRFASCVGLAEPWATARETPLSHSFCQHVVVSAEPLIVEDARTHPLLHDNLAIPDLGVVAYAGVPLVTSDGQVLGAFCVIDGAPRRWTAEQVATLTDLAGAVSTEMELLRSARRLAAQTEALDAQRAELEQILDATEKLICATGADGHITYVNRAWSEALGYTAAEAATLRPVDFVAPEHRTRYLETARRLVCGDVVTDFEATLLARDGGRIVCRGRAVPIMRTAPDGTAQCVGTRAWYRDVTPEQIADARRGRLVAMLDASADFVGTAAPDGSVEYLNAAGRRMLGLALNADLSALRASDYHPPATLARLRDEGLPAAARDGRWSGEGALLGPDGTEIPVSMVVVAHPSLVPGEAPYFSAVMRDLRDRMRAEQALRESEARLGLIYNTATDLMFLIRVERDAAHRATGYRCESVNEAYLAVTGLAREQLIGRTLQEILPADAAAHALERYEIAECTGDVLRYDETVELPGRRLIVETTLTPVLDDRAIVTHLLGVARDVSVTRRAQAATRESEARFRGMFENLRVPAVQLDPVGRVAFANDALLDLTGWTRADVLGADWFDRFVPDEPSAKGGGAEAVRRAFEQLIAQRRAVPHFENEIVTRTGERRLIAWDNVLMEDADGRVTGTASIGQDVTHRRALEAKLAALSEHDELTALLNRRGFRRMATQELKSAVRTQRRDAVLYLDLDRFKPINDTYGHAAGDDVLRAVADVVRATIRDADFGARIGGDEFAVYALGMSEGDGRVLAARLRAALDAHNEAAAAAGRPYRIACSIGVAELEPGDELDELLARADAALYVQKLGRLVPV